MTQDEIIKHCYDKHLERFDGKVKFTFDEYKSFWKEYDIERRRDYLFISRDMSTEDCKIVYFPIPYYDDLRALIEIKIPNGMDYREVPTAYLKPASSTPPPLKPENDK